MAKRRSSPTRRKPRKETSVVGIMREMRAGVQQISSEQAKRSGAQPKNGANAKSTSGSLVRRFVIILLVGAGLIFAGVYGIGYITEPWARSWPGHKPLVGYWQGEMTFAPGDVRLVALHLKSYAGSRPFGEGGGGVGDAPNPEMEGEAKICGPQGNTAYEISGDVKNRQGTSFQIGFGTQNTPGSHPDVTQGTWDGEDVLQMQTRIYTQTASQASGSISTQPGAADSGAIRFEMRRTNEGAFNAAC